MILFIDCFLEVAAVYKKDSVQEWGFGIFWICRFNLGMGMTARTFLVKIILTKLILVKRR